MDDLAQWLGKQLDEEEQIARAASDDEQHGDTWEPLMYGESPEEQTAWGQLPFEEDPTPWVCVRHAARHDPARVLREIDAKRQILARYVELRAASKEQGLIGDVTEEYQDFLLRVLALPYADRPGYREEWRP